VGLLDGAAVGVEATTVMSKVKLNRTTRVAEIAAVKKNELLVAEGDEKAN
jgi:hypothetical protein